MTSVPLVDVEPELHDGGGAGGSTPDRPPS